MSVSGMKEYLDKWLKNNYGSKRGFVFDYYCRVQNLFNRFKKNDHQDLSTVERIVFICKGNVCRSAYAEAFAKTLNLNVISCGIDARESAPANKKAIAVAKQRNIDLESHKTTPLLSVDFKKNDLLLVMEPQQVEIVANLLNDEYRIGLLGLWCSPKHPYLHDPYSSSMEYFGMCFNHIEKSVYAIRNKTGN